MRKISTSIILAALIYGVTSFLCTFAQAATPQAFVANEGRIRMNFNADWRFKLGDVPAAKSSDFDDAAWQSVGLPHSFSIPYFRSPSFYVGYGWYRKTVSLPALPAERRLILEFEGVFQEAEVFVNGTAVGHHRGGYTGFPVDITHAVKPGRNLIAVRVNNKWDPTLAPRAGEHVFSGGIYRDVWLIATNDVHVPWTGVGVTTPDLSNLSGRVAVDTEVRNDSNKTKQVTIHTEIVEDSGKVVATLSDSLLSVPPFQTVQEKQLSGAVAKPRLWSPETPVLYRAKTSLIVAGHVVDRYETEFGFRWISWTADRGFFLNGVHRYFKGANVHQDQAGWGDAVTNGAIDRDVQLIKDAGFDFIRGSHYPHDPHFTEATDRIGVLYLSEVSFWGTAGFKSAWAASAYPTDPAQWSAFDASVKQQLEEMIRINRNHPSIIAWGMDNEVFFSARQTMPQVRRLLAEEVALTHKLDPTRPASVDGAQRGAIDHIGDIVGYNGDGASLFPNPGIPNFIAEYGSSMSDRPGPYEPGWDDLPNTPGMSPKAGDPYPWRLPWRSGEVIWAGFDHGSIAGRKFGGMGLIDYSRLPKRAWYWYRHTYRGIVPPPLAQPGKPAALRLTSSSPTIKHADGTDDVQLVVTVVDAQGRALSNTPPVKLTIESGPGELPTGRSILFAADTDIPIIDGQAAIAMRSWQSGHSRIRATSPGLQDGVLDITTTDGAPFVPGVTPIVADRPYVVTPTASTAKEPEVESFGIDSPTDASSSAPGHSVRLVNDGNPATYWTPESGDSDPWISIDVERIVKLQDLVLTFPKAEKYGFVADVQTADGSWKSLAKEASGIDARTVRKIAALPLTGRRIRVRVLSPDKSMPALSEITIIGVLQRQ